MHLKAATIEIFSCVFKLINFKNESFTVDRDRACLCVRLCIYLCVFQSSSTLKAWPVSTNFGIWCRTYICQCFFSFFNPMLITSQTIFGKMWTGTVMSLILSSRLQILKARSACESRKQGWILGISVEYLIRTCLPLMAGNLSF